MDNEVILAIAISCAVISVSVASIWKRISEDRYGDKLTQGSRIAIEDLAKKVNSLTKALSFLEESVIKSFADLLDIDKQRSTSISKLLMITDSLKKRLEKIEVDAERALSKALEVEEELRRNNNNTLF